MKLTSRLPPIPVFAAYVFIACTDVTVLAPLSNMSAEFEDKDASKFVNSPGTCDDAGGDFGSHILVLFAWSPVLLPSGCTVNGGHKAEGLFSRTKDGRHSLVTEEL